MKQNKDEHLENLNDIFGEDIDEKELKELKELRDALISICVEEDVDEDVDECLPEDLLDNTITLNDENGEEVKFKFLDLIEYQGEEFVVLLPCEESDDDGEVVILKIEDSENDDTESYSSVDDEKLLNTIFEIFKDKYKDTFDFVDED